MDTEILYVVLGLLVGLLVDMLLGVMLAIRDKVFRWQELPATLRNNVLPYVVPIVVLGLVASAPSSVSGAIRGIYLAFAATYGAKVVADVGSKLMELYNIHF